MLATFAVFFLVVNAYSQAAFDVISIDGNAKLQHVGEKEWERVSPGSKLRDNDIVGAVCDQHQGLGHAVDNITFPDFG